MTAPNPDSFLTVADIAREIGLHRQTVTKAISEGRMPGQLFGTTYRISVQQWTDFKAGTWRAPVAASSSPLSLIKSKRSA